MFTEFVTKIIDHQDFLTSTKNKILTSDDVVSKIQKLRGLTIKRVGTTNSSIDQMRIETFFVKSEPTEKFLVNENFQSSFMSSDDDEDLAAVGDDGGEFGDDDMSCNSFHGNSESCFTCSTCKNSYDNFDVLTAHIISRVKF